MTNAKFHLNQLIVTLTFGIRASEMIWTAPKEVRLWEKAAKQLLKPWKQLLIVCRDKQLLMEERVAHPSISLQVYCLDLEKDNNSYFEKSGYRNFVGSYKSHQKDSCP